MIQAGTLAAALAVASATSAAVVDFTFTGTVRGTEGRDTRQLFGAGNPTGEAYTAYFSVDEATAILNGTELDAGPAYGVTSFQDASVTIGGTKVSFGADSLRDLVGFAANDAMSGTANSFYAGVQGATGQICSGYNCELLQANVAGSFTNPISRTIVAQTLSSTNPVDGGDFIDGAGYTILFGPARLAIAVEGVSGAPEPSTWALMLVGVGLIGAGLRSARRRGALSPSHVS